MLVKTVYVGGVNLMKENMVTVFKSKRHIAISELNNWLFDYQYAHQYPIKQLPPLDDWNRSTEDSTYWYINFPNTEWTVWIRSESVEF